MRASDFNENSVEHFLAGMKLIPLVAFRFGNKEGVSNTL